MKTLFFLLASLYSFNLVSAGNTIEVAGMKTSSLDYETYVDKHVRIYNLSSKEVLVAAIDTATGRQVKGFGLNGKANAVLFIDKGLVLTLKNRNAKAVRVELEIVDAPETPKRSNDTYVTFTLRNSSAKSIPLLIPGVMNPNLSPFSNSGVSLKVGQEVLFRYKGKTEVLFIVDDSIQSGDKLDVATLLKDRKAQLDKK